MEIYLVRHTPPLIDKGICYGQSHVTLDMEVFEQAFAKILNQLPESIDTIYSSPLERCHYLAQRMQRSKYPSSPVVTDHRLQEINFGRWEQKPWSSIPEAELNPWMNDFVNMSIPGGESYRQLYQRSVAFFTSVVKTKQNAVVTTHSGVIRSILSYCSGVELENSFNAFELSFGCIARLDVTGNRILFPAVIR